MKRLTRLVAVLISFLLVFVTFAGCGTASTSSDMKQETGSKKDSSTEASVETRIITDMSGKQVEIPMVVDRYADAWFAHNEVVVMLDKAERMVATVETPERAPWEYLVQPNMYNALSTFGDDFNLEELVPLKPQVVFDSDSALEEQLNSVDIPVVNVMFSNYDEMKRSITLTGDVLGGDSVAMAAEYCLYLDETLKMLDEKLGSLSEDEKPSVLHGNSVYTLAVDGSKTIIDAWIDASGGVNSAQEVEGNMQTVTLEQVLDWNPDIIITGTPSEVESILNDPAWAGLTAVKTGQVYANPRGVFSWDRYGVEGALQLQWAAQLFHPDLIKIDIDKTIKEFYHTFLNYELTDAQVNRILNAENPE